MAGWRFSPWALLRGHIKVLSIPGVNGSLTPDRFARWTFALGGVGITVAAFWLGWTLKSPDSLLAGAALLAGSLVGAFGQVASWRDQVRQADNGYPPSPAGQLRQDSIDETATHLLLAAYISGAEAVIIVIGLNVSTDDTTGALTGPIAALAIGVGGYLALLFFLAVPRLYSAYVEVNEVRKALNGQAH